MKNTRTKKSAGPRKPEVAIYFGSNVWKSSEYLFAQTLGFELVAALAKSGTTTRVFADYRREEDSERPLPELAEAVAKGAVSAIICPILTGREYGWIRAFPVPVAMVTAGNSGPEVLHISPRRGLLKALREAREAGVRSVGLISHRKRGEAGTPVGEFEAGFRACADACGMAVREAWMEFCGRHPDENLGFEAFAKLWKSRPRPGAIFVDTDILSRGVVTAVLSLGVRVPRDLKLVLHRNDLLPYPCPFPATFLETPVARCAGALLEMLEDQAVRGATRRKTVEMRVRTNQATRG